ncbi:hypothetical protein PQE70_gp068 [Bacillus phage vB_BanS_Nate]|uniref:Uncharacterized protein n=1 Tax=Bacillus phage vB_BanS_Nate TaxID=2894788 RepID=A0AAE8YVR7_9CAUD|nr:hypothetical protein PQE70_gp068 [Bacillus phage vB_BanS_Nate]UGO50921.1 hypothetical protein NATE_68 [Bacillus phage vB_BanS_Nate]
MRTKRKRMTAGNRDKNKNPKLNEVIMMFRRKRKRKSSSGGFFKFLADLLESFFD